MELILNNNRKQNLDRPLIMGILNITPDSFSDGGDFLRADAALKQAEVMIEEGADIIDIGGESTRPGSARVSLDEERNRVLPIIEKLRANSLNTIISIDTYKAQLAKEALEAGADIVNIMGGLNTDPNMLQVLIDYQPPWILYHVQGTPETMQEDPKYRDVITDISNYFEAQINQYENAGGNRANIILDPGIGFGKRHEDNLRLLNEFSAFKSHGCPLLIGSSRKSFLERIDRSINKHDRKIPPKERLAASLASIVQPIYQGAHIVRTHDVKATKDFVTALVGIKDN